MELARFSAFLRQRRTDLGMTQAELAEKLNVTDKAVSRWERGKGYPEVTLLEPLANALDVSLEELMQSRTIVPDMPPKRPKWFPTVMGALTFTAVMSLLMSLCVLFFSQNTYLLSRWNPDFTVNEGYTDRDLLIDQSWTSLVHTAYEQGQPTATTRFRNGLGGSYTITHDSGDIQKKIKGRAGSGTYLTFSDMGEGQELTSYYEESGCQVEWYSLYRQSGEEPRELVKRIEMEYLPNLRNGICKETMMDIQGTVLSWRQYDWKDSHTTKSADYDANGTLVGYTEYSYSGRNQTAAIYTADGILLGSATSRLDWQGRITRREIYNALGEQTGLEVYRHRPWERFGNLTGICVLIAFAGISLFLAVELHDELKKQMGKP